MVRNLLIIANPCPPAASTGASMRLRKWCEYLPDFGWQPTVVTGPLANSTRCAPLEGVSVLAIPDRASIPSATEIRTTALSRWTYAITPSWLFPDPDVQRWLPDVAVTLETISNAGPFDAIVSSSPQNTCHLVAAFIQRRLKLPWIADFRDPWVGNPLVGPRPLLADIVNRHLERRVVTHAQLVTCASPVLQTDMMRRYPWIANRFRYLPNGYDSRTLPPARPQRSAGGLMTMIHAGALHGSQVPEAVLDAMMQLPTSVQLHFIGGASPALDADILRRGLNDRVTVTPPLAHDQALAFMAAADALLVIPGAAYAISATVFEYVATGRPIINVGPQVGAVAELLRNFGVGRTVEGVDGVLEAVRSLLIDRQAIPTGKPAGLAGYDRRHLAGALAAELDLLVSGPR